jgi:hypothetical protein
MRDEGAEACAVRRLHRWQRPRRPSSPADAQVVQTLGAFPRAYQLHGAASPSILCIPPKDGTTLWSLALRGSTEPRSNLASLPCLKGPAAEAAAATAPRIMLTRDPYSRLLSVYLDKVHAPQVQGLRPSIELPWDPTRDPNITFASFVTNITAANPHLLNMHIKPQSLLCGLSATFGFEYDYFLPIEEIDEWYVPLVLRLGIEQTVQNPEVWNEVSKSWKSARSCFYAPDGDCGAVDRRVEALKTSCSSAASGAEAPESEVEGRLRRLEAAASTSLGDQTTHATGAHSKREAYYTPALADLVTEWARADLERFHYPRWRPTRSPPPPSRSHMVSSPPSPSRPALGSQVAHRAPVSDTECGSASSADYAQAAGVGMCIGVMLVLILQRVATAFLSRHRRPVHESHAFMTVPVVDATAVSSTGTGQ